MKNLRPIVRRPRVESVSLLDGKDPVIAQIYASRGATDAADFDLAIKDLLPVSGLSQIEAAVDLLLSHKDQSVLIVGDFDADGATSSALVLRCLREFGFSRVDYLVPNRFEFGYGLSPELVDIALKMQPSLIVTVDNGVSSFDGVAKARAAGIAVLITDHHLPPDTLPDADLLLNPNLADEPFESKNLAGVGVAFYLMAATGQRLESMGESGAKGIVAKYLDLVALGTVADVVPLDRNNRILIEAGLKRIRAGKTVPGILAILAEAGRDYSRCVASDLGFALGPRLNAAGRLEDMSVGIEALICDQPAKARQLAAQLGDINKRRRETESDMQADALQRVTDRFEAIAAEDLPGVLCLYEKHWHQGIVGLIASKIRERINRPVFAFAKCDEENLKGSGRSIPGVHLRDLLAFVDASDPGLLGKYGGHAMAAGLTLPRKNLHKFERACESAMTRLFPEADFEGQLLSDGELPVNNLQLGFAELLRACGPFGQGFAEPVFDGVFQLLEARVVGETHAKLRVMPKTGDRPLDAIAFGQAECLPLPKGSWVELVYRLDVNEFRGIRSAQLMVEQLRPCD